MKPEADSGGGILIAEDHRPTADLLHRLLVAEFPGYRLRTAYSAEEALDQCRAAPPRVVIMDISLPGMNGIEATRRIKACAPAVQVVMHSALDAGIYAEECAKAGASAYVGKAKPQAELVPVVARLLRGR
jgi:DNA-binding NarL/FixJ family response regulator